MATAVDFDGEHPVLAIEVNDKLVDGALAQKADTKDLFFAEVLPEDYFAFGHSFAELAGASDEMFVVGQDVTAHRKDGFSFNLTFYFFLGQPSRDTTLRSSTTSLKGGFGQGDCDILRRKHTSLV